MLDVIADFWKPVKKAQQPEPFRPELLQIGSTLGFGFVPQVILSGRRLQVSAVNTYLFGEESLTSFVLSQEKDPSVSMIVAESEGEYYLAISRRISLNDRVRLFNEQDLDMVMTKQDAVRLSSRETLVDYKGWVVSSYKREIQGLRGHIFKGDYRKESLPEIREGHEFEYTLLVSDSNEHAIEIEKYIDGRIEVYATVYRRMSDIGEITHPTQVEQTAKPEIRLASTIEAKPATQSPVISGMPRLTEMPAPANTDTAIEPLVAPQAPEIKAVTQEPKTETAVPAPAIAASDAQTQPVPLPSFAKPEPTAANDVSTANTKPAPAAEPVSVQPSSSIATPNPTPTRIDMTAEALKPKLYIQPTNPEVANELKAAGGAAPINESIECDLRVANKIIDEAIRNEMRLTDIVRRIIELPVAYPEAVQIPMTLNDEDFALLAIRYGIPASDRGAIKRRIVEELNDFSGKKKA